jgi:hypothetical protein
MSDPSGTRRSASAVRCSRMNALPGTLCMIIIAAFHSAVPGDDDPSSHRALAVLLLCQCLFLLIDATFLLYVLHARRLALIDHLLRLLNHFTYSLLPPSITLLPFHSI